MGKKYFDLGMPEQELDGALDILDADGDNFTATKVAVDRQIEDCKVASAAFDLKLRPDRPGVLGSQRRLRSCQLSLIPWHPVAAQRSRDP